MLAEATLLDVSTPRLYIGGGFVHRVLSHQRGYHNLGSPVEHQGPARIAAAAERGWVLLRLDAPPLNDERVTYRVESCDGRRQNSVRNPRRGLLVRHSKSNTVDIDCRPGRHGCLTIRGRYRPVAPGPMGRRGDLLPATNGTAASGPRDRLSYDRRGWHGGCSRLWRPSGCSRAASPTATGWSRSFRA